MKEKEAQASESVSSADVSSDGLDKFYVSLSDRSCINIYMIDMTFLILIFLKTTLLKER